jgi:hypothetical protein
LRTTARPPATNSNTAATKNDLLIDFVHLYQNGHGAISLKSLHADAEGFGKRGIHPGATVPNLTAGGVFDFETEDLQRRKAIAATRSASDGKGTNFNLT